MLAGATLDGALERASLVLAAVDEGLAAPDAVGVDVAARRLEATVAPGRISDELPEHSAAFCAECGGDVNVYVDDICGDCGSLLDNVVFL